MEYRGILKLRSSELGLKTLKNQASIFFNSTKYPKTTKLQKISLVIAIYFAIYSLSSPAENIYFKQKWRDGKTLEDITRNKVLKPWYKSSTNKNIFFHETSLIEDGIIKLNARQACAIESAALLNSDHNIFVTFASQVGFRNTTNLPIIDAILAYPNVHLNYLNITKYAENTPMEDWIQTDILFRSKFVVVHTSDVVRLLSLFKYGGSHVDLDMIMLKPLSTQKSNNFAGSERDDSVNNAFIHVAGKTGHKIAENFVREVKQTFYGQGWAYNGPEAITRVLSRLCGTKSVKAIIENDLCKDFQILPISKCYEIKWYEHYMFFEEKYMRETLYRIKDSLMAHIWNSKNAHLRLSKDANAAYIQLAKKYCPKTFEACDSF